MKIKQLREKRDAKINQLDEMVNALEVNGEVRALTDVETADFKNLEKEIKDIDATIAAIEMRRALECDNKEEAVKELEEKRNMDSAEKRALESFFRGEMLEPEVRKMLSTTSGNAATIPLTISKTLIKKLEEQCPILEEAKRFSSKGTLRLLREDNYGQAAITAEDGAFHDADPTLSYIELKSHKITASVDATFEIAA
ncbi:MAG: phage major capsid protein [Romboutsia sp.]|nr:phage major capsid protein [Romboutsia sp.]MBP3905741.1 phage major capsid protein [Peptostreptococcaceae bacterium]